MVCIMGPQCAWRGGEGWALDKDTSRFRWDQAEGVDTCIPVGAAEDQPQGPLRHLEHLFIMCRPPPTVLSAQSPAAECLDLLQELRPSRKGLPRPQGRL